MSESSPAMTTPTPEAIEDFLHELDGWETAYPLSAFPEPDLKRAAELLKAGGMTLDAISASNMRHVVSCIAPKARTTIEHLSALLREQTLLVDRLCTAVDQAAEDIGHESIDDLLRLIGPANDRCIEALGIEGDTGKLKEMGNG